MGKGSKKARKNTSSVKVSIQELKDSRNGGQVALRGYSYQFLYSCYLILSSSSSDISFQLEGVEDIDFIEQKDTNSNITHIQLKYSTNKQNASFLSSVLKNFLETYLLDQNRYFKLVYDFPVAEGHLDKLIASNLDENFRAYWVNVISDIQKKLPSWNWSAYDFDSFISHLSFEKVEKSTLADEIEKALIKTYDISTDNIALFANSIKVLCFEKMEFRAYVTKTDLDLRIQSVLIDISKGVQNPAHSWIRKLDYSIPYHNDDQGFYEGKKSTPVDIACGLPVKRPSLEKDVIHSICENTITVIKASSGQGKTTLALQIAYELKNEYVPYQLLWCDDIKELGNIVQYFKSRIQLGEKLLILIDNLDSHLSKWNHLAQLLQSELPCHYKLLVTSRESDWYNYSGDLSNIHSLKVIKPTLNEQDAVEIFKLFKSAHRLHPSISTWQSAWGKIAERKLLIEYVYLLTHGEMLAERITSQISEIGRSSSGIVKCEILRQVCFADICGIRLSISKLLMNLSENFSLDFGEILKSLESEFLVQVSDKSGYIEGLHPVRSKHIVDKLHEFLPVESTAISVIKITEKADLPTLFSHLPEFALNKEDFCHNAVDALWNEDDLSNYIPAIRGLFSGSVMQYYLSNKAAFDDANIHGGLPILLTEVCPFTKFTEFGVSVDTFATLQKVEPENKNIKYLCNLRDNIPTYSPKDTLIYVFCTCLYRKLFPLTWGSIKDITSYAAIAEWLYNMNPEFNLSVNFPLDDIWASSKRLRLECISTLMYISYCGNKDVYTIFVTKNLSRILTYLKHQTKSYELFVDFKNNAIHVSYILPLCEVRTSNEQSVSRLKCICKTLPIFDLYCADGLKPTINMLSIYTIPDDAHKRMPLKNLVIMFHQPLTSLWRKTILSNYEFDTVAEWLNYWFTVRQLICSLADSCCFCISKILSGNPLGRSIKEVIPLCEKLFLMTTGEKLYPREERPFEEKAVIPIQFKNIANKYFQDIRNFSNQFAGFLHKDLEEQRLTMLNLTDAKSTLTKMQDSFSELTIDFDTSEWPSDFTAIETKSIEQLIMYCSYYQVHSPSKYFNKYQIKSWYDKQQQDNLTAVKTALSPLASICSVHFPFQSYVVGILRYYPIIVNNFDTVLKDNSAAFVLNCIEFAEAPFDYLVILSANNSNHINPIALQFSRQMFIDVKKAIRSNDSAALENITYPYPVNVTSSMLDCFIGNYNLLEKSPSAPDLSSIGDIAENLWIYSKSVELLSTPEDADYLASETQRLRTNITEMLQLSRDQLSKKDFDWLVDICNQVFSGKEFDDKLFNDIIEHFTSQAENC